MFVYIGINIAKDVLGE